MKAVGVRELKNRLSQYLRQVKAGEGVLVTDRGEIIAELMPPGRSGIDPSIPPGLAALAKRGLATLATPGESDAYPALPRARRRKTTAAELLDQERGQR
jgi:prevent-host-death family protein